MSGAASIRERHAQELAARLPPLLVAAERVAATVVQGEHGRRRVGQGDAFWQFRRYQPGDSAQLIDWRQSAKSDPLYVRETEWAAAQTVWLWCDASPSMAYRSQPALPSKHERAALMALALAVLLVRAGERVALLGGLERPASGRAVLGRMAATLEQQADGPGLPAPQALPRHCQVVLAGDLLAPLAEVEASLRHLSRHGVRGHLVQVLDPAEEAFPFAGRIRFTGMESEGEMLIARTEDVRNAYVERLQSHRDGLAELARTLGWSFLVHHTDRPPQAALLALHAALSRPL